MKRGLSVLLFFLPLLLAGQNDILSGLWKLKQKKSIKGPNYENGIPDIIEVVQQDAQIIFISKTRHNDKDTLETEVLKTGLKNINESFTISNKKKQTSLLWDSASNQWVRKSSLSAREKFDQIEIQTTEIYKLSESTEEMTVVKYYDGADLPGGNEDYSMLGVYVRTTKEQLEKDTSTGKGVKFVEGLTWIQILKKAKDEKKFIFVDCYATWCLPCKKMDKEVFTLNKIGSILNDKFISVKVQMDTSVKDGNNVKLTYSIARLLEKKYAISALPTYLFFNGDGMPLHKATGAASADYFERIVQNSQDPSEQLYTLIENWRSGKLSNPEIAALAVKLEKKGEKEFAEQIARSYFECFLYKLSANQFFSVENIQFFNQFNRVIRSNDKMFIWTLKNPAIADSLSGMKRGFAAALIESVISREDIQPVIELSQKQGKVPDWGEIVRIVSKKYQYNQAYRLILRVKTSWYKFYKHWDAYIPSLIQLYDTIGDLSKIHWLQLDGAANDILDHSNNKEQLQKALAWSELAIQSHINDRSAKDAPWGGIQCTYANLLYKLGRKAEAIKYFQQKILGHRLQTPDVYENYVKMFKGLPTWATN